MSDIPLFSSRDGKVYNLAGNVLTQNINVCSIADYLGSLDVNMPDGTYVRFAEKGGVSYGCYHYQDGILYSAPQGNPFNDGYCQGVSRTNPSTITFNNIPDKSTISPPFLLTATSNQPMPIHFTSANPGVIYIIGNSGYIAGVEDCVTLNAIQNISGIYGGNSKSQEVCVGLIQQHITAVGSICVPNTTQNGDYDIDLRPHFTSNRPGANIQYYSYTPFQGGILEDEYTLRISIDNMLYQESCFFSIHAYEFGGGGYSSAATSVYVSINADFCDGSC